MLLSVPARRSVLRPTVSFNKYFFYSLYLYFKQFETTCVYFTDLDGIVLTFVVVVFVFTLHILLIS